MNPAAALEARDLCVQRNGRALWPGLSFRVPSGTLLCVTGRNGSGKTTLLSTLAGITEPEHGDVLWCGRPARKSPVYRQQMAYLAHNNGLNADLPVRDNLSYAARLANALGDEAAIMHALSQVGMEKHGRRLPKHLSQGQQRRIGLARVMMQRAQLWLLDEPFNALDAEAARHFGDALAAHLQCGGIAIATTHQPFPLELPTMQLTL